MQPSRLLKLYLTGRYYGLRVQIKKNNQNESLIMNLLATCATHLIQNLLYYILILAQNLQDFSNTSTLY